MRRDLLRHFHQHRRAPMIANIRFHGGERLGRIVVKRAKSCRDGRRDGAGGRRRGHSLPQPLIHNAARKALRARPKFG